MIIEDGFLAFANDRQKEIIQAINEYGGIRPAARALNLHHTTVADSIRIVRRKAAISGFAPENGMSRVVPEPFIVRGISTYYNAEGKASGQWVKSRIEDTKLQEMMRQSIDAMKEEIPRLTALPAPPLTNDNLLNCYVVTDYHLGMLSWDEETGENWDVAIAETLVIK